MKRLVFLIGGAAALALGACSSNNQDAVNNAELNQPAADDLNTLANQAASNADTNAVNQADQNAAAEDNSTNPTDAIENNVDAM